MGASLLRISLPGGPRQSECAAAAVRGICRGLQLDDRDVDAVELCVAEAVNNVSEHAYRGAPGAVEVELLASGTALEIRIADDGVEMDPRRLANAARLQDFAPDDLDSLPEGGMGLHLIRTLTQSARYERRAGRNFLTLVYQPGRPPPA